MVNFWILVHVVTEVHPLGLRVRHQAVLGGTLTPAFCYPICDTFLRPATGFLVRPFACRVLNERVWQTDPLCSPILA